MALVSYDVSDTSDVEEEDSNEAPAAPSASSRTPRPTAEETEVKEDSSAIFSVLPTPRTKPLILDGDLKRLLMNPIAKRLAGDTKKSVKISVPALAELEEENLPRPTIKVNPSKGSRLFDILPPPKNTTAGLAAAKRLVPDIIRKPPPKPVVKPPPKLPTPLAPPVSAPEDEESDEEEDSTDFLGLTKKEVVSPYVPLPIEEIAPVEVPEEAPTPYVQEKPVEPSYSTEDHIPFSQDSLLLDDEALQRLCGGSKRRRTNVQAQLIDVSEADVVPDKNEWMVKQLTEQKVVRSQSHKKNAGPSSQQKRKHQITYLAFQAKEQEQELQNQWANNKMTKKQTQSKYGF